MSFDEDLFGWVYKKYKKFATPSVEVPGAIYLDEVKNFLRILACCFGARPYEIHQSQTWGGVQDLKIFLPERMSLSHSSKQNVQAYIYRVLMAVGFDRERIYLSTEMNEEEALKLYFLNMSRVGRRLRNELAGFAEFERNLVETSIPDPWRLLHAEGAPDLSTLTRADIQAWPLLYGLVYPLARKSDLEISDLQKADKSSFPNGTEIQGKSRENIKVVKIPKRKLEDSPLVHIFEKVKTAEEYLGGNKNMDGSDEVLDHADALDQIEMKSVVRTDEGAASLYRADISLNIQVPEIAGENLNAVQVFSYPEWDFQKKILKQNWCTLRESQISNEISTSDLSRTTAELQNRYGKDIDRLRQHLQRKFSASHWRGRQKEGPEIDLERMVDRFSFVRAGQTPPENLYMRRERRNCDWASYILMDISLSTDSWVRNKRVLDFEREAIYILAEAMKQFPENIQVGAFYSHTRKDCNIEIIKSWDEPWTNGIGKLWSVKPKAYTRIGPAIRHAIAELAKVRARKKFLILLSDGKPTDFDRYEGVYGIEDVKHALRQASEQRILSHALTVMERTKGTLAQMFLHSQYQIVRSPQDLADHLLKIYSPK